MRPAYYLLFYLVLAILPACNTRRNPSQNEITFVQGSRVTLEGAATQVDVTPFILNRPFPSAIPACRNDAQETRLIVGERGRVSDRDEQLLNVREGPGTQFSVISALEIHAIFLILEGPTCSARYTWYRVRSGDIEGWIAEGDRLLYFVEPYFPG